MSTSVDLLLKRFAVVQRGARRLVILLIALSLLTRRCHWLSAACLALLPSAIALQYPPRIDYIAGGVRVSLRYKPPMLGFPLLCLAMLLENPNLDYRKASAFMIWVLIYDRPLELIGDAIDRTKPVVALNFHVMTDAMMRNKQRYQECVIGRDHLRTVCNMDIFSLFLHLCERQNVLRNPGLGADKLVPSLGEKIGVRLPRLKIDGKLWGAVDVSDWWTTYTLAATHSRDYALVVYPRGGGLEHPCRSPAKKLFGDARALQGLHDNSTLKQVQHCFDEFRPSSLMLAVSLGWAIMLPLHHVTQGRYRIRQIVFEPSSTGLNAETCLSQQNKTAEQAFRQWQWPQKFTGTTSKQYDLYRAEHMAEIKLATRLLWATAS